MIVCICKNVSSTTLENVIEEGAYSIDAVKQQTGVTSCCGKCRFKVNRMLHDKQNSLSDVSNVACSG